MKKVHFVFAALLAFAAITGAAYAQRGGGFGHHGGWFGHHHFLPGDSTIGHRGDTTNDHHGPPLPPTRPNNPFGLSDSCYQVFLSMIPADSAQMLTGDLAALAADAAQMDTLRSEARAAWAAGDTATLRALHQQMIDLGKQSRATWSELMQITRTYDAVLDSVRMTCGNETRPPHHDGPGGGGTPPLTITNVVPNPVPSGTMTAQFTYTLTQAEDVTITLSDVMGHIVKNVFTGNVTATTPQTVQLDLSGLQREPYILRVQAGNFIMSEMVIVQ